MCLWHFCGNEKEKSYCMVKCCMNVKLAVTLWIDHWSELWETLKTLAVEVNIGTKHPQTSQKVGNNNTKIKISTLHLNCPPSSYVNVHIKVLIPWYDYRIPSFYHGTATVLFCYRITPAWGILSLSVSQIILQSPFAARRQVTHIQQVKSQTPKVNRNRRWFEMWVNNE